MSSMKKKAPTKRISPTRKTKAGSKRHTAPRRRVPEVVVVDFVELDEYRYTGDEVDGKLVFAELGLKGLE